MANPTRREEIIAAATELFARDGYHAVGMRAIADAVGVRGASLYHHFPSKIDLLHAIALDATRGFIAAQLPELERPGPAAERLRRVVREHVLYFHAYELQETVARRELAQLRAHAPERYAEIQAERRAYQDAIEAVVAAGARAGELDVADPRVATLALLGMINSVHEWFGDGGPLTIEQVADAYATLAVERLLAGPAQR